MNKLTLKKCLKLATHNPRLEKLFRTLRTNILTIKKWLKLATHNPTIEVLFRSLRNDVLAAFCIAFASIFLIKLCPDFLSKQNTFLFVGKDIWENICYSIVASTVFYFVNQHIPEIEKKVSCYHFEVNNVKNLISEIKGLLERPDGRNVDPKTGVSSESIYDFLDLKENEPPRKVNQYERDFANWNEYLKQKTELMSSLVNKLLPVHQSLERSTIEYLFKVEAVCYKINKSLEQHNDYLTRFTHDFTDLMYCMVGLSEGLEQKYKQTKAINDYRDKIHDLKNPYPSAYDYKRKYLEEGPPKLKLNEKFLLRLLHSFIFICVMYIIFHVLT